MPGKAWRASCAGGDTYLDTARRPGSVPGIGRDTPTPPVPPHRTAVTALKPSCAGPQPCFVSCHRRPGIAIRGSRNSGESREVVDHDTGQRGGLFGERGWLAFSMTVEVTQDSNRSPEQSVYEARRHFAQPAGPGLARRLTTRTVHRRIRTQRRATDTGHSRRLVARRAAPMEIS
jgi:hypothetical protein